MIPRHFWSLSLALLALPPLTGCGGGSGGGTTLIVQDANGTPDVVGDSTAGSDGETAPQPDGAVGDGVTADTGPGDPDATVADEEAAFQAALALYNASQFADAAVAFEAFVSAFPDSARMDNAVYLIARSHFELGQFAVAKGEFTAFMTDHAASSLLDDAHYYVGRSSYELLAFADAIQTWEAFLAAQYPGTPYDDNVRYFLGRSQYATAHFDLAVGRFDEVITVTNSSFRDASLWWAGRAEYEWAATAAQPTANYTQADSYFETLFNDYPGSVYEDNARYYYGMTRYQMAEWDLAVTRLDDLRTRFPQSIYYDNAWYFLARSHFQAGRFATAFSELDAFSTTFPDSSYLDNAVYWAGRAKYELGAWSEALPWFQRMTTDFTLSAYLDNAWLHVIRCDVRLLQCGAAATALTAMGIAVPGSPLIATATQEVGGC